MSRAFPGESISTSHAHVQYVYVPYCTARLSVQRLAKQASELQGARIALDEEPCMCPAEEGSVLTHANHGEHRQKPPQQQQLFSPFKHSALWLAVANLLDKYSSSTIQ